MKTLVKSRKVTASTRAQALVETAIVVVMLVFLVMGIAEVGWAFMRTNMVVNAARDGARFGATLDESLRDSDGCFTGGITAIQTHVQDQLDEVGFEASSIEVHQPCVTDGGINVPVVEVVVNGTLDLLFMNFFSILDTDLQRTVTFADENRTECNCST